MVVYTSSNFIYLSFLQDEISSDPGGLMYRYVIKGFIAFGFVLLALGAVSEAVKNFKTLQIGFDPDEIKPIPKDDPKVQELRRMLGVQPHEKMILTVGGDVTSKGAQEMFKALIEVDKDFKDWKYVLKLYYF